MTALAAPAPLWQGGFAGRRFNVADRILLTGIASQAASCKQSLRILLAEWTYSERALLP